MARLAFIFGLLLPLLAFGDLITLKDGTVVEGTAIRQGDEWWIKTTAGKTMIVSLDEVKSVSFGHLGDKTPVSTTKPVNAYSYVATQHKAEDAETALAAIALWQKYIDAQIPEADRQQALKEQDVYIQYDKQNAEKIGGKWLAGDERMALIKKASASYDEAAAAMKLGNFPAAIKQMQETGKIYPNSYALIFQMGWVSMQTKQYDQAEAFFEAAVRNRPESPEALNNFATIMLAKDRFYERGVATLLHAAQCSDSEAIAKNVSLGIGMMPPATRDMPKMKGTLDAAKFLAEKYKIAPPTDADVTTPTFVILSARAEPLEGSEPYRLGLATGAGVIVRDDGLVITNKHIVEKDDAIFVVLDGGQRRAADLVSLDTDSNLALIKIRNSAGISALPLAKEDVPANGAKVAAYGFKMIRDLTSLTQRVEGRVTDPAKALLGTDVAIEASLTPDFSGGPVVNEAGQVAGIINFRAFSPTPQAPLASAISAAKVRAFLTRAKISLPDAPANPQTKATSCVVQVIVAKQMN